MSGFVLTLIIFIQIFGIHAEICDIQGSCINSTLSEISIAMNKLECKHSSAF